MHKRSRMLLAALVAVLMLAVGASAAAGNRGIELSVSEGELGRVGATSRGLTFTDAEVTFRVVCEISLNLTLNRSIAKSAGAAVGLANSIIIRNCSGGNISFFSQPWPVTYTSFAGTLPRISSLDLSIEDFGFLVSVFFALARCSYGADLPVTTVGSPISEVRLEASTVLSLVRDLGGFTSCPPEGRYSGAFTLSPTVRMALSRCTTPPAVRVDEGFQRQEGANATIGMTAQVECDNTRIDSIRTTRANESIGIEDRERAVGRTFRRGERFRYDLRLTAREGTRVVEENVEIAWTEEGGSSRGTTRVRFTDL